MINQPAILLCWLLQWDLPAQLTTQPSLSLSLVVTGRTDLTDWRRSTITAARRQQTKLYHFSPPTDWLFSMYISVLRFWYSSSEVSEPEEVQGVRRSSLVSSSLVNSQLNTESSGPARAHRRPGTQETAQRASSPARQTRQPGSESGEWGDWDRKFAGSQSVARQS